MRTISTLFLCVAICLFTFDSFGQTVRVEGGTLGATSLNTAAGVTPAIQVAGSDALSPNGYGFFVAGNATAGGNMSMHTQISTGEAQSRMTLKCGDATDFAPRLQMISGNDVTGSQGAALFDYGSRNFDNSSTAFFAMRFMPTVGAPVEMIRTSADDAVLLAHQGGNVGVGTASPAVKLHVVGDIRFDFGTPVDGDVLSYDAASGNLVWAEPASGGGGGSFSCTDLTTCLIQNLGNVNTLGVAVGDALIWDGANWVAGQAGGGGGAFSCTDLNGCTITNMGDVNTLGVTAGDVLMWDGANWVAGQVTGGGSGFTCTDLNGCLITNMGDVNTLGVQVGDFLQWNGSAWVAGQATGGGTNQTLSWNSSTNMLSISSGNSVDLSSLAGGGSGGADTDWVEDGDTMMAKAGGIVVIAANTVGDAARLYVDGSTASDRAALFGVIGTTDSNGGAGLRGNNIAGADTFYHIGAIGVGSSTGTGINTGVRGDGNGGDIAVGMEGYADLATGSNYGVFGFCGDDGANLNSGIVGICEDAIIDWAGYFAGDINVTGTVFEASDARLKRNVTDMDNGLEVIMSLRPVAYKYKEHKALNLNPERQQYGFIAQEMESILPSAIKETAVPAVRETVMDENGNIVSHSKEMSDESYKMVNYNQVIPFLTKAVQEQQGVIDQQNEIIEKQAQELAEIKAILQSTGLMDNAVAPNTNGESSQLFQNRPNPFDVVTEIPYFLAEGDERGEIMIYAVGTGEVIKRITVNGNGYGKVRMEAGSIAAGTYSYSLVVGGQVVSTKTMVITE